MVGYSEVRNKCVHCISQSLVDRFFSCEEKEKYIWDMSKDGTYGDELCLTALSLHFKINIQVYSLAYGILLFGDYRSQQPVRLSYNDHNHYDAILHRKPLSCQANLPSCAATCSKVVPDSPKEQTPTSEPAKTESKSNLLKLLSINVSSWEPHASCLLSSGADILALQETRLSDVGILRNQKSLACQIPAWSSVWGVPPGNIKTSKNTYSRRQSGKSCQGGVAILATADLKLLPTGRSSFAARALYETSRWCAAAIPLPGCAHKFLHVVSFWGSKPTERPPTQPQWKATPKTFWAGCYAGQPAHLLMYGRQRKRRF